MNVAQLKKFCARLPGAEVHEHGPPANILVYTVGGKRFAHFKTSTPQRWRFSIKVADDRFLALTDIPGIQPARWLARYHWITIVDVSSLPTAELTELVMWSYRKALSTLSRTRRAQFAASGPAPQSLSRNRNAQDLMPPCPPSRE